MKGSTYVMAKTVIRKPAAKRASAPTKKAPVRKGAAKVETKPPADKPKRGGFRRKLNSFGFVPGTDSDLVARILIEGGADQRDINAKATEAVKAASGLETRTGSGAKNIPSLTSAVRNRLLELGFTVKSHYQLIPPDHIAEAMEKEAAAAQKEEESVKPEAPAKKKVAAKKKVRVAKRTPAKK